MQNLPSGTVTFFFSDIEGSTQLLQALGEAYTEVLEGHAAIIRDVLKSHRGLEIATEGDSFFVVFEGAPQAVAAAVEIQRGLAARRWPGDREVRVRIGLHTGEARLLGDNYGGLDVHRAARIAASGHGGQVVLSDSTRTLVEHDLPAGVTLRDLGSHRLKDLELPEHLWQFDVDGMRTEWPALRSVQGRPNNLPLDLTSFVGREKELVQIADLLREARLLTLTGPGGTGKTRLSLRAAADALAVFDDGVFFVPLATIEDPDLVPTTMAGALGLAEEQGRPISETLKVHIEHKQMLLVLDNLEQILGIAPFISELLRSSSGLKIITSSRAPLRISGEQEFPVPPLVLPDASASLSAEDALGYESVALFVQRASSLRPGFVLDESNAAAIAGIAVRLDGLPLAIELAAARVRVMSVQEILKRLEACFDILTGGGRDLPARQQTLRGAIDWSYDLLGEPERALFRRLSIFVGGWTLEAAQEICDPDGDLGVDVLSGIESLVDNSLVRTTEAADGGTRFRMLVVIREYGLMRLRESGEEESARARHRDYFISLTEAAEERLTGDPLLLDRLEEEHDNLRSILKASVTGGDAIPGLRIAATIWRFWQIRSHLREGRAWLADLFALASASMRDGARAKALSGAGALAYWEGDYSTSRSFYEESLAIFEELDDPRGIADQTYAFGFLELIAHNDQAAVEIFRASKILYEQVGDVTGQANATWGEGWAAMLMRDDDRAFSLGQESLEAYRALDHKWGMGSSLWILGRVAREADRLDEARAYWIEALDLLAGLNDASSIASCCADLAIVALKEGLPERAVKLGGAAAGITSRIGFRAPPEIVRQEDPRGLAEGRLSKQEVDAAWREGFEMSLDEAVAFMRKDERATQT
ncbi:MAG TPA: adenylate/guanylate cyclase domain-containing protein [Actinomycetota bacterium]|nr:adenylate/guanylate cyclase domain-containing protein [Actinomycetota bacterium]